MIYTYKYKSPLGRIFIWRQMKWGITVSMVRRSEIFWEYNSQDKPIPQETESLRKQRKMAGVCILPP